MPAHVAEVPTPLPRAPGSHHDIVQRLKWASTRSQVGPNEIGSRTPPSSSTGRLSPGDDRGEAADVLVTMAKRRPKDATVTMSRPSSTASTPGRPGGPGSRTPPHGYQQDVEHEHGRGGEEHRSQEQGQPARRVTGGRSVKADFSSNIVRTQARYRLANACQGEDPGKKVVDGRP